MAPVYVYLDSLNVFDEQAIIETNAHTQREGKKADVPIDRPNDRDKSTAT